MNGPWMDITVGIHNKMPVWPGDPSVEIDQVSSVDDGDACTLSRIAIGSHVGTHMDAPKHFLPGGESMDALPFDAVIGPATVIAIEDPTAITVDELKRHNIQPNQRLLFKTRNSPRCWQTDHFVRDYVCITEHAAQWLVDRHVQTVGVDYLSVAGFDLDSGPTHRTLLAAGVWIIEGLNLTDVLPGNYTLMCLPLKLIGCDGAPARALLGPAQPSTT